MRVKVDGQTVERLVLDGEKYDVQRAMEKFADEMDREPMRGRAVQLLMTVEFTPEETATGDVP